MITCLTCNVEKSDENFPRKLKSGKVRRTCRECLKQSERDHNDRTGAWKYRSAKERKIDVSQHPRSHPIWLVKEIICPICGQKAEGRNVHIDHCHDTGKIRDLICHQCNVGLGGFRDNPEVMLKAIEYLNKHKA